MTDRPDHDEPDLTAHFAAARETAPVPDAALLARVLEAGEAVQRAPAAPHAVSAQGIAARVAGIWRAVGGWPSAAGLATAALAGVWIGVAPPPVLQDTVQVWLGSGAAYVIDAEPVAAFFMTGETM